MRHFFSLGIVRAIVGQFVGLGLAIALVNGIRAAMGLEPDPEAAWVAGAFLGAFTALLFSGVLTDWIKWAAGKKTPYTTDRRKVSQYGHAILAWITTTRLLAFSMA